jgi:hypothetical protein
MTVGVAALRLAAEFADEAMLVFSVAFNDDAELAAPVSIALSAPRAADPGRRRAELLVTKEKPWHLT